jgi:hypothetical protein
MSSTSNSRLSLSGRSNSSLKENHFQKASDEMIIRKYKVLPNIRRSESIATSDYYRPTGALPMNSYEDYNTMSNSNKQINKTKGKRPPIVEKLRTQAASPAPSKNKTVNHFAGLKNSINNSKHNIHETMDLDEDLPINPIQSANQTTNRTSYTTPAERTFSPINRPPAPSPSKSIMKHYVAHHDSDSDDSLN